MVQLLNQDEVDALLSAVNGGEDDGDTWGLYSQSYKLLSPRSSSCDSIYCVGEVDIYLPIGSKLNLITIGVQIK